MAKKPISTGVVVLLVFVGVFNLLAVIGLLALSYYAKLENHPGVDLAAKPGPEEAQLFLGPRELAGLGLLPKSVANAKTPAPVVELPRNRYRLVMTALGSHFKEEQTILFQKGSPSMNKAVADFITRATHNTVPEKPNVGHDHFTVGKEGARVDAWSRDGRYYFLSVWADNGGAMIQILASQPLAVPDHAALGASVDGEFQRVGAYAAKHSHDADSPKQP